MQMFCIEKTMIMENVKPTNIIQYIEDAPVQARHKLFEMYACIKGVAPDAKESLKWGMPAFSYKRILVTFAGFNHHIGFYPTSSAINAFQKSLSKYTTAKGSIQFPLDKPLPLALIRKITLFRLKESREDDKKWRS
jgi:uncharacterized protein YdhG (YjbR/CyaY superfamily)